MPSHFLRLMITALAVTLLSSTAIANDGRDFGGVYSLADVTEQGDRVQVTLSLQIFNYSGGDLKRAEVTVRASQPELELLGSFAPIPLWRNGHDVILSRQLTVPLEEYKRWSSQGQPNLFIFHTDENGQTWRATAQITRRPAAAD